MKDPHELLFGLITSYTSMVEERYPQLFLELAKSVPDEHVSAFMGYPLNYIRHGWFPPSGILDNGMQYKFHGIGCYLQYGKRFIDLDFGPNGEMNGFDASRLLYFSRNYPRRYGDFKDYSQIHELLLQEEKEKNIERIPNSSLWRVVE